MVQTHYRINCGSETPATDTAGNVWAPDTGFAEGGGIVTREPDLPIQSTRMPEVLRSERYGLKGYRLSVAPGQYSVRFYAAETFEGSANPDRAFGLALNGQTVAENFMPYQVAGGFTRAAVVEATCEAGGGEIHITFYGNRAIANALEIEPASQPAPARITAAEDMPRPTPRPAPSENRAEVKVLFIGNSGTFFWDIPLTTAALVNGVSTTHEMTTDMMVSGGKTFKWHWEQDAVRARLKDSGCDYVVLQDGTAGLKLPDQMHDYGARLINTVRAGGATPLLYAYFGPKAATPDEFANALDLYATLARTHGVTLVPAAATLRTAMDARPEVNFHNPDRHHSGMFGGYAFSTTFYRVLTGQSAADHPYPAVLGDQVPIPADMAALIGRCADDACARYDALSQLREGPLAR